MNFPKYDGNIHPDEWINDIQKYLKLINNSNDHLEIAISLVNNNISLPTGINSFEKLRNALREDYFFTIFQNTNKRKLQSLKYIPESEGGDTSKFISNFLKLCYNAEINNIEEQKYYLYKSLPMSHFNIIESEFLEKMKNVNSTNELVKEFEDFAVYGSNLITNESIVALKHIASGKYLSSVEGLRSHDRQLVFVGSPVPDPNSLWKIKFDKKSAAYTLQHVKSDNKFLGISFDDYESNFFSIRPSKMYPKHTKVNCDEKIFRIDPWIYQEKSRNYWENDCDCSRNYRTNNCHCSRNDRENNYDWKKNWNGGWEFISGTKRYVIVDSSSSVKALSDVKSKDQVYLKSNDIINLKITENYNNRRGNRRDYFLRSHDIQFTMFTNGKDERFQEVVCHDERLGGNDEWCIELIKKKNIGP
ncbi:hypothetical protein RclHR1_02920009 [Rhizophagus clarus]|uniref:MIR domain-containing protein n=1 Tax=Rhizophagus clarus TaxID=94130 RepID=A0A2Z6RGH3_9GLOM|nr:hypothetical protein RclHR1_02920009 [Rhizophagus clarus]GES76100.1 hypothetical protein GLOIN_2v1543775 [Rhizophagus clarus]